MCRPVEVIAERGGDADGCDSSSSSPTATVPSTPSTRTSTTRNLRQCSMEAPKILLVPVSRIPGDQEGPDDHGKAPSTLWTGNGEDSHPSKEPAIKDKTLYADASILPEAITADISPSNIVVTSVEAQTISTDDNNNSSRTGDVRIGCALPTAIRERQLSSSSSTSPWFLDVTTDQMMTSLSSSEIEGVEQLPSSQFARAPILSLDDTRGVSSQTICEAQPLSEHDLHLPQDFEDPIFQKKRRRKRRRKRMLAGGAIGGAICMVVLGPIVGAPIGWAAGSSALYIASKVGEKRKDRKVKRKIRAHRRAAAASSSVSSSVQ